MSEVSAIVTRNRHRILPTGTSQLDSYVRVSWRRTNRAKARGSCFPPTVSSVRVFSPTLAESGAASERDLPAVTEKRAGVRRMRAT